MLYGVESVSFNDAATCWMYMSWIIEEQKLMKYWWSDTASRMSKYP